MGLKCIMLNNFQIFLLKIRNFHNMIGINLLKLNHIEIILEVKVPILGTKVIELLFKEAFKVESKDLTIAKKENILQRVELQKDKAEHLTEKDIKEEEVLKVKKEEDSLIEIPNNINLNIQKEDLNFLKKYF